MKDTDKILCVIIAAWLSAILGGCVSNANVQLPKTGRERPLIAPEGADPEHIVLTWNADPATTQAVTWRTHTPCKTSVAQIALASPNPDFGTKAVSVKTADQTVKREDGSMVYYHTAVFENLAPSTLYAYRVGDGKIFSEWNQFKTADIRPTSFRFIYFGDEQNDIKMYCSRVIRQAYATAPDARFIVHAGDLVSIADSDPQWNEWFEAAGWVYRVIPSIPIIGNHEQPGGDTSISRFWRPQFALPLNGPAGLEELTYYLDYNGVRLIALNGTRLLQEQSVWLETVLANNPARWTIIGIHQPMFSSGQGRDSVDIQKTFMPLIDKYHVDLVLQGHDHTYFRTHKIYGGAVVDNNSAGTVYCTSVVGPKQYPLNPRYEKLTAAKAADTQLFQIIAVDPEQLAYQSFTANGDVQDSFTLKKTGDRSTRLIENSSTK